MDKAALVEELIKDGEKLIKALDEAVFEVTAGMWFYSSDIDEWRLIIASPLVDKLGHKKAYNSIQKEMDKIPQPFRIELRNISVVSHQDPLIKLMSLALSTGPGIAGIRFTQNVINNVLIEDAYIYRNIKA